MVRLKSRTLFAGAILLFELAVSSHADVSELPPDLRTKARCMLSVAQVMDGVTNARWRIDRDAENFATPVIEYEFHETDVAFGGTRKYDGTWKFLAVLSGLTASGTKPSDEGTGLMIESWSKHCKVDALSVFE